MDWKTTDLEKKENEKEESYELKQRRLMVETNYIQKEDQVCDPLRRVNGDASIAELYFDKYIANEEGEVAEGYQAKSQKYRALSHDPNKSVKTFSKKYKNHGESKRKGALADSAEHYEKASEKYAALTQIEKKDSPEYIKASVAVLKERLEGMLCAAEAKSFSKTDEKLRKAAATIKICSAMIFAYSKNSRVFKKEIAKTRKTLDKAQASYLKYKKEDAKEKAHLLEGLNENEEMKEIAAQEKAYEKQLSDILQHGKVDFIPKHLSFHIYSGINKRDMLHKPIFLADFRRALKNYDPSSKIGNTPEEMDSSLSTVDHDRTIVQTVISAFRMRLFTAKEELEAYAEKSATYEQINSYLRKTPGYSTKCADYAENLKSSFAKKDTVLDYDVVVHSGGKNDVLLGMLGETEQPGKQIDYSEKLKPGTILTDHGIVSTSVMKKKWFKQPCELIILCKKGTHALNMSHGVGPVDNKEEELAIAPGTKFRVVKYSHDSAFKKNKLYLETVV